MPQTSTGANSKIESAIIDLLIDIPLFDKIDGKELGVIAKHMNFIELKQNEILFKEGAKGDYVCFVVDGIIEVLKQTIKGANVNIAKLSKGRSIGEMSIIDNTPRSATVRSASKSTIVTLSKKGFDTILEEQPKIGIKILKGLARLLSLNMRKTSSRLADYMLSIN